MAKPARNIPTLNYEKAMDFFMKSEQYYGFELPEYFVFDEVLKFVREKNGNTLNENLYIQLSPYHLWFQYMTYILDKKNGTSPYSLRLCKLVMGNIEEPLWNNGWIRAEFVQNMPIESIVNKETLKKVTPVIMFRETRAYNEIVY